MKLIVIDAWPNTGIGWSILWTARWLNIANTFAIDIKFMFCMPVGVTNTQILRLIHHRKLPVCSNTTFDLHDYIDYKNHDLKVTAYESNQISKVFTQPSYTNMSMLLHSRLNKTIAVYYTRVKQAVYPLVKNYRHELRLLRFKGSLPNITCGVGLHVRTMLLDHSKCNVFEECTWRVANCNISRLSAANNLCANKNRFVTSDSPEMYKKLSLWKNIGDVAVNPSFQKKKMSSISDTIKVWFILSSCKTIISPVVSQFSITAAQRGHSKISRCC